MTPKELKEKMVGRLRGMTLPDPPLYGRGKRKQED
jgi:hypothetical protein